MALKDCIKKMKGLVTKDDKATLQEYLDAGLDDKEAVRKLLLLADKNVLDITKRAAAAGATVANRPDFIGEIRSLQTKRAEKIRADRKKISDEEAELNVEYGDNNTVIDHVKNQWARLPENTADNVVLHGLDIYDDQALTKVLSAMLFNPDIRPGLINGTLGLKGKGPVELVSSFKKIRDSQARIRERLLELSVLDASALDRLEEVGERRQETYYQGKDVSEIGFRSGLLSAVRIMPQEKGPAAQMIAYLKKQPGVKKEELEWIDFEAWANAKGAVTREEMILYVQENGVQVQETVYGGPRPQRVVLQFSMDEQTTQEARESREVDANTIIYNVTDVNGAEVFTVYDDRDAGTVSITPDDGETWIQPISESGAETTINNQHLDDARRGIQKYIEEKRRATSLFAEPAEFAGLYQLEGGTNYREIMLHLPDQLEGKRTAGELVQDIVRQFNNLPSDKKIKINAFYEKNVVPARPGGREFIDALRTNDVELEHFKELGIDGSVMEKNFRELLKTRELIAGRFISHAFEDVPNILAWMRVKDRIGPNGEKILFVEEIQSDWHSAGRDQGYAKRIDTSKLEKEIARYEKQRDEAYKNAKEYFQNIAATGAMGTPARKEDATFRVESEVLARSDWYERLDGEISGNLSEAISDEGVAAINKWRRITLEKAAIQRQLENSEKGIADAPFKGNAWAELSMKRILRLAAEGGYDQVAWTTGAQQNERYSLTNVVSSIGVNTGSDAINVVGVPNVAGASHRITINLRNQTPDESIRLATLPDGEILWTGDRPDWIGKDLSSVVGEEVADRILNVDPNAVTSFSPRELEVGGEGMDNFYDQVLPNVVNKVARKLDKSAKVKKFGGSIIDEDVASMNFARPVRVVRGDPVQFRTPPWQVETDTGSLIGDFLTEREALRYMDDLTRRIANKLPVVHALDVTDNMQNTAMEGMTLFQKEKGSITFDEMRRGLIRLSETRDLSTFLHEAGHLYLETMRSLAEGPGAPQDIKDDWKKILDYLEVSAGREIVEKHHELFARTFEKYLSTGRAPSIEMQDSFNSFRRWMELIPGKLRELAGIELSEEITGVFDRILASERQISEAEAVQEYAAIFATPEDMGVSREVFEVYRDSARHAHQESVDRETKRMLDYMRREELAWWKTEKEKVRVEVTDEAHNAKVYIALSLLQKGTKPDGSALEKRPFKLDRDDLIKRYGRDFIKRLPKPWVYSAKGGMDVGLAAQLLGYTSADEMVEEFARTPKMAAWIRGETNARMQDRFPDPMMDATLSDNAVKAVHTDRRASVLSAEMRALRKRARDDAKIVRATKETLRRNRAEAKAANMASLPKRLEIEQIKAGARLAIGKLQLRDVQPRIYLNAERRAGKKAFEAAARGDYQTAYMEKRRQIVNLEMYRAAIKAKTVSEATQRYLTKFEKKRVRQRLGKSGILDQIDTVLEGIEFRKRSLTDLDYRKYLKSIITLIEDGELVVDPDLAAQLTAEGINWQELTVQQFAGIRDVVKQLEFRAKKLAEAVVNGEKVILQEAANEVANQLYENNKIINVGVSQEGKGDRTRRAKNQAISNWLRPSSIARVLDKAGFGAITRHVIVPMRRAYAERLIPGIHKAQQDLSDIYLRHYSRKELATFQKRQRLEAMGQDLSKSDILSIALNWGNEGNRAALLGGMKRNGQQAYTEQGTRAALATMTKRDWEFVQDIWDYYDTYWNDLSAAEQRRRGIMPEKVAPTPFTIRTADGEEIVVKGGYHPLVYDRRHSDRIKSAELEDLYKQMGNGVFISTSTRAGATYDRVRNHGMVVKLGLNSIDTHLREIVRDIAIGDEVNFIKRLLNSKTVQDAFHQTGNETSLDTLNLWLTDAAVGELPAEGWYEQSASWIRTGFTKSKLAWNALTTILQFTGIAQTIAVIGTKSYAKGLNKFMQNPTAAWKHVMATSKFMEARYSIGAWNKDVADAKAHLESFFGAQPTRLKVSMNALSATYFWPIARAQQVVDVTTWLGSFEKGRNELSLSESDAILYADAQVEAAQTSGFFSDRSGLERGTLGNRKNRQSQFIRIWTTLISYMLAKGNIAYEKTGSTNFRKPTQVAAYVGDLFLLFTVEGIASALIYGQWPDDDDEPEDWVWWGAKQTVLSVASGIPFVREIPAAKFGGGNTPIGSFAKDAWDLGVQASQGDVDDALRRKFVTTTGTLFHYPASQTNRFLDAVWAEDEPEWYEYILGDRDK